MDQTILENLKAYIEQQSNRNYRFIEVPPVTREIVFATNNLPSFTRNSEQSDPFIRSLSVSFPIDQQMYMFPNMHIRFAIIDPFNAIVFSYMPH